MPANSALRSRPPRWLLAAVLGAAVLAFLPLLPGGFLADDFVYLARFQALPWAEWPRLFVQEWSGGAWGTPLRELRPVAALSFMSDARLFGAQPLGYQLTNLALHLIATLCVARLAWLYSEKNSAATLLAGLLFAVHPAHVEAVGWITGRVDLLGTTGALLYWLAAELFVRGGRRGHLAIAVAMLAFGVFAKELCLFAPLLLALCWVTTAPRADRSAWARRGAVLAGSLAVIAVYAVCRRMAFAHGDSIGYNVWTDEPAWHRQASYASWLAPFLPFTDHGELKSFPALAVLHGLWIALAVVVAAGLAWSIARGRRRATQALFFGGGWYFVTVAPLTAVVYHSPRHLYFPSVGLALALGLACGAGRWARVLGAGFVVWCAAGHVAAVQPWRAAAAASRTALAEVDRAVLAAGPGVVLVSAAPATIEAAWMWAWSSPPAFQPPFVAHAPARVIEHPVNYSQARDWMAERRPLETIRAAPAIVALHIDERGGVNCRTLRGPALAARVQAFEQTVATGLSPEAWTAWVKTSAAP
jgi:hypothetical protein